MGIFTRFTLRSLAKNRTRTVVSILGIALSCALVTAIFTSVVTMADGLYRRTLADEGSWQVQVDNLSATGVTAAREGAHTKASAVVEHYGAAALPADAVSDLGPLLEVDSYPASPDGVIIPPEVTEGSAPASPDEILLPSYLKNKDLSGGDAVLMDAAGAPAPGIRSTDALQVGSTIELALGRRTPFAGGDANGQEISAGSALRYSDTLKPLEYLDDIQPAHAFTVVGFYDDWSRQTSLGCLAFTGAGAREPVASTAYLATDITSFDEMGAYGTAITTDSPGVVAAGYTDAAVITHNSLLRYQGMTDGRGIWSTLAGIAAVLATVVIVASVSLIYNAFAISVSERTRQFGLLSSLGASRRQLRRTVFLEAGLLAVVAIPLGVVCGLAGTWAVFRLTGEGLALLFGAQMGAAITISPAAIALAAVLSLVTILVSVAIPARRAGRVSAIDAIRQAQDVKLTRRERARQRRRRRRTARHGDPFHPGTADRIRLRLEGIPGFLAHRNLTRARGKGRVAVASLAVSVALLIISGVFGTYMESVSGVVSRTGTSDLMVTAGTARQAGTAPADYVAQLDKVADTLAGADGAEPEGYATAVSVYAILPADMMEDAEGFLGTAADDGNYYTMVSVRFIDDASWRTYLAALDIDAAAYTDPARPRAIAFNDYLDTSDGRYQYHRLFAQTGTLRLITQVRPLNGYRFYTLDATDGTPQARYYPISDETLADPTENECAVGLADAEAAGFDLAVGALAAEAPACDTNLSSVGPALILPLSALPAIAATTDDALIAPEDYGVSHPFSMTGYHGSLDQTVLYYFNADDPATCAASLQRIIDEELSDSDTLAFSDVYNLDEAYRQNRMIAVTIQTFTTCFSVICGLIAVANVFNTLSTSIILRRREFAVLKSIGMGERAFRRMIVRECASYAVRGLAAGIVLAVLASVGMYVSMEIGFSGVGFALPPLWVGIAVGSVLVVLTISVVYALRRCRAAHVVEALREDAI